MLAKYQKSIYFVFRIDIKKIETQEDLKTNYLHNLQKNNNEALRQTNIVKCT